MNTWAENACEEFLQASYVKRENYNNIKEQNCKASNDLNKDITR